MCLKGTLSSKARVDIRKPVFEVRLLDEILDRADQAIGEAHGQTL